jgi:hypothetical protein
MAMLMVNSVFARIWGDHAGSAAPQTEFWTDIIQSVQQKYPGFIFLAEVYWGMQSELQSLGFDYTYDKQLYDRLKRESVHTVRDHLLAASSYQRKLVRFIENHDEERAMSGFGLEKSQAAAVIMSTVPGAKLFHDGQFEGRRPRIPVQLARRPKEQPIDALVAFYRRLTTEINDAPYHNGTYMALGTHPILGTDTGHENMIATAWVQGEDWRIAVVNYCDQPVKGRVMVPRPAFAGMAAWRFYDVLNPGDPFLYVGDDLLTAGLPLDMPPFGAHMFVVTRSD